MFDKIVSSLLALLTSFVLTTSTPPQSLSPSLKFNPGLESIFSTDHTWVSKISDQPKITLITTGDVLTARTINAQAVRTNDFDFPYVFIKPLLSSANLVFVNLETPLLPECPVITSGTTFCGHPRHAQALKNAGVNVANLANNHIGNYGNAGVDSTIQILTSADILPVGTNQIAYKKVKGVNFAFLGYNQVGPTPQKISSATTELVTQQVQQARTQADVVIVQFHWGNEYTTTLTSSQKDLAHLAIDTGADIVASNHPHWIQPVEIYKGKPILYAHGNFIFDQYWSQKTQEGIVAKFTFIGPNLLDLELTPIVTTSQGQPQIPSPQKSAQMLNDLQQISFTTD